MKWIKRVLHIDPCFASTDAFIPYVGDAERIHIATGHTVLTSEDVVTLTFFPEEKLNASVCIITWFRDNVRGEQFIKNLELENASEVIVRNTMMMEALTMSLVYMSPD